MGGKTVSSSNSLSLGSQRLSYPCRNQRFWYWRRTVCVQNVPHAGVYPSSRPQPRVSNPNSDERKKKRKDATLSCSGEIGVGWLPAERFGAWGAGKPRQIDSPPKGLAGYAKPSPPLHPPDHQATTREKRAFPSKRKKMVGLCLTRLPRLVWSSGELGCATVTPTSAARAKTFIMMCRVTATRSNQKFCEMKVLWAVNLDSVTSRFDRSISISATSRINLACKSRYPRNQ